MFYILFLNFFFLSHFIRSFLCFLPRVIDRPVRNKLQICALFCRFLRMITSIKINYLVSFQKLNVNYLFPCQHFFFFLRILYETYTYILHKHFRYTFYTFDLYLDHKAHSSVCTINTCHPVDNTQMDK